MSADSGIHSWPCSFYQERSRRWIPGRLSLTPLSVRFTCGATRRILLESRLSRIQEIKKESSSLIFSSLTLLEGGTKHWFSSLQPSRNAVFNVLEHFWREQLLGEGQEGAAPGPGKGRELVGMLQGSQRRLEDTAKVLHSQGEQFDNIMRGLHKIEGDMDVADRLLTELESPSWWPFSTKLWKTPLEWKPKENPPDPKPPEPPLLQIPAIITHGPTTTSTTNTAKPGKLTLLPSCLEIRDGNSQLLQRFPWRDVDEIRVVSPYELSVRQRFIGRADTSFGLLAARMPRALPLLRDRIPGKIRILEGAPGFGGAGREAAAGWGESLWQEASGFLGAAADPGIPAGSSEGTDEEQQQLQKISQEEVKELRQILRQLQGLALETEAELERQDEALECIGSSAERATLSVQRQNQRIRRLT